MPAAKFSGARERSIWLPNAAVAKAWTQYVNDTAADLESGLAHFLIERDGQPLATVPPQPKNPHGRPIFQGLQYSDTPAQPLVPMRFTDTTAKPGQKHRYRVIAVNTAGLKSK